LACGSALWLFWAVPVAHCQLVGAEFQINTHTTADQKDAAAAFDGAGNFIVVWHSYDQDGSGEGIFARRFDAEALPLGPEFQVNASTADDQVHPSVAADALGNFVVVWDYRPSAGPWAPFGRRFDVSGAPLGGDFEVNSAASDLQYGVNVAMGGGGDFVVVWNGYDDDETLSLDIFARRFDAAGAPLGEQFQVSTYEQQLAAHREASVVLLPGGDFVVVWSGDEEGLSEEILGQRFDSEGTAQGGNFRISMDSQGPGNRRPSVARLATGGFVVVWSGWFASRVFGRRYDAAGMPLGDEFQVSEATGHDQVASSVAGDGLGGFAVVWWSTDQGGPPEGIFGRLFDSDGNAVSGDFQVNGNAAGGQRYPWMASDGAGDFIAAWDSDAQDGDGRGVFARRLRLGVVLVDGFESGDTSAWSAVVP